MNKRGQFYLIAAIIIISVLVGFAFYRNSAKVNSGSTIVYDLGKELNTETGNVYDYGVYNGQSTDALISNWTSQYYDYASTQGGADTWIFVYGSQAGMTAVAFSVVNAGSVSIDTGGKTKSKVDITTTKQEIKNIAVGSNGKVTFTYGNTTYPFTLESGQNFFFVIKGGNSVTTS